MYNGNRCLRIGDDYGNGYNVYISICSTGGDYIISDYADCSYGFKYKETENSRKKYTNWNNRRNSISMYDYSCYYMEFDKTGKINSNKELKEEIYQGSQKVKVMSNGMHLTARNLPLTVFYNIIPSVFVIMGSSKGETEVF